VDEIVLFEPLTRDHLMKVVDIQTVRLGRLLAGRGLKLEMTDRLRAKLAEIGYDPEYGARPLKRTLQRMVMDPLARRVLEGGFAPGTRVRTDWDEAASAVTFETVTEPAAGASGAARPAAARSRRRG
jgi:ATP-dependent Clp protease ATP-binding subunit ClpB